MCSAETACETSRIRRRWPRQRATAAGASKSLRNAIASSCILLTCTARCDALAADPPEGAPSILRAERSEPPFGGFSDRVGRPQWRIAPVVDIRHDQHEDFDKVQLRDTA